MDGVEADAGDGGHQARPSRKDCGHPSWDSLRLPLVVCRPSRMETKTETPKKPRRRRVETTKRAAPVSSSHQDEEQKGPHASALEPASQVDPRALLEVLRSALLVNPPVSQSQAALPRRAFKFWVRSKGCP